MNKNRLIVMAKPAEKGNVKTRLAADVGDEMALEVYELLLQHTLTVCKDSEIDTTVFWSKKPNIHSVFNEKLQSGIDLGERMFNAISALDFEKVVVVGTDCPDLSVPILYSAFEALQNHEVVFGPAADGGYYLIGMRMPEPQLFENINWSTSSVLAESISKCTNSGKSYALLPVLSDIDDIHDLKESKIYKNSRL